VITYHHESIILTITLSTSTTWWL